jgi:hypothetical protein
MDSFPFGREFSRMGSKKMPPNEAASPDRSSENVYNIFLKKATFNLAECGLAQMIYQKRMAPVKFLIFDRPDSWRQEKILPEAKTPAGRIPCDFRFACPPAAGAAFPGPAVFFPPPELSKKNHSLPSRFLLCYISCPDPEGRIEKEQ